MSQHIYNTELLKNELLILINQQTDPFLLSNLAGLLSVSAVTSFELSIKDVFIAFAAKKSKSFENFTTNHFGRINGRIKLGELSNEHIAAFGEKYKNRFNSELDKKEFNAQRQKGVSIKNAYNNLIVCRHKFVHGGSATLTLLEVIDSFVYGQEVIQCLSNCMRR